MEINWVYVGCSLATMYAFLVIAGFFGVWQRRKNTMRRFDDFKENNRIIPKGVPFENWVENRDYPSYKEIEPWIVPVTVIVTFLQLFTRIIVRPTKKGR